MRFILFGNTFQAKKSAHTAHIVNLLQAQKNEIYIGEEFYHFLTTEQGMDLRQTEL